MPKLAEDVAPFLESYYTLEHAGRMDDIPKDLQDAVGTMRSAGLLPPAGIDNFHGWQQHLEALKPGQYIVPEPAPGTTSETTTPTTQGVMDIPGRHAGIGQMVGGIGLPAALTALGPETGGLTLPLALAAAHYGGMGGELAQQGIENALGLPPSRTGTSSERRQVAGQQSVLGEATGQALSLPARVTGAGPRVLGWMQSLTPTGRASQAVADAAAQEVPAAIAKGAQETSRAGALGSAQQLGPQVRAQADAAVNVATGQAQQQAATAEAALPRRIALRSDRLQGPAPETPQPRTSPIVDEFGRPIVTQPRAKVLRKLTSADVSPETAAPRRILEQQAGQAQATATLLNPIRGAVGDVQTVRLLARSPDAAQRLLDAAQTPEEKQVIQWAIETGQALGKSGQTLAAPAEVVAAAKTAALDSAAKASGFSRNIARGLIASGAGLAGLSSGHPLVAAAAIPGSVAIESIVRNVLDRSINARGTAALANALGIAGDAARPLTRPLGQGLVRVIGAQQ